MQIVHFTVVCLVIWPLSGSEAGGDLVLIQTLLLFICKHKLDSMRTTPASLPLKGQDTKHTTVKWAIEIQCNAP